ncbi:MAG: hypothetical protein PHY24_01295 [Candidatus Cloacimonetes bacterium]|nr:hypothetical protein [Candidatus Cloacimonadota bacterium]
MKKLIIVIFIIWAAFQLEARMMVQLGVGVDVNGKQSFSNAALSQDSDVETGASLYGDYYLRKSLAPEPCSPA